MFRKGKVRYVIEKLKVMELVRHNINRNMDRIYEQQRAEANDTTIDLMSALMSTGWSLVAADIGEEIYRFLHAVVVNLPWIKYIPPFVKTLLAVTFESLIVVAVFVALFLLSYRISKPLITKVKHRLDTKKRGVLLQNENKCKLLVDEFDHTACDAIIFARNFALTIPYMPKAEISESERYNYYEAIYYLEKAAKIAKDVYTQRDGCISITNNANGITIHRYENVIHMLSDLTDQLEKVKTTVIATMTPQAKHSLETSFNNLRSITNELNTHYTELLKLYSKALM